MKRAFAALCGALAYFTIVPVGRFVPNVAPGPLSISFLPLIGAAIGAISGALAWLAAAHGSPWWPVIAWMSAILLTGAIHVDGFLDCCDALFASATPAKRLEILKDPRHGTFALVGMAMLTVVWLSSIARIAPPRLVVALAFAATLSRVAALANAWVFPYARAGAITPAFVSRPNVAIVAIAAVLAALLAWRIDPIAIAIVPVALVLSFVAGWWASTRLGGGLTGDAFGAIVVVVDVAVLALAGTIP